MKTAQRPRPSRSSAAPLHAQEHEEGWSRSSTASTRNASRRSTIQSQQHEGWPACPTASTMAASPAATRPSPCVLLTDMPMAGRLLVIYKIIVSVARCWISPR